MDLLQWMYITDQTPLSQTFTTKLDEGYGLGLKGNFRNYEKFFIKLEKEENHLYKAKNTR